MAKIQQDKKNWGILSIILLASIVSFTTTYAGMYALFGIDEDDAYYHKTLILFGIVFLIQASLLLSIKHYKFKNFFDLSTLKVNILVLLMYFVTLGISVLFSFTFYYEVFSAEKHSKRNMKFQLNHIDNTLLTAKNSLLSVVQSLSDLSTYSYNTSQQEVRTGGTCDGVKLPQYGPFTQIRLDDRDITKTAYQKVAHIAKALDDDIIKLRQKVSSYSPKIDILLFEEELNNALKTLNSKYFNPDIYTSIEELLLARSGQKRHTLAGYNTKKKTSFVRSCVDNKFSHEASTVVSKLRALQALKSISLFNPHDKSQLLDRAKLVLFSFGETAKISTNISHADDITQDDKSALLLAFIVDGLIFVLTIMNEQRQHKLKLAHIRQIEKGLIPNDVYHMLKPYMTEPYKHKLIAIPNDVEELKDICLLIEYTQLKGISTMYITHADADKLRPHFDATLLAQYGTHTFSVYKMKRDKYEQLLLEDIEGEVA